MGRLLSQTAPDGHQLREVPADEAPSVRLDVTEDPDSGWNVHLETERFEFTPEEVGGDAEPGGGHAHLYVDGEKIARVYGSWYHLSPSMVPRGEHTLMVQLNANDHSVWATDGEAVSASTEIRSTGESDHGSHEHGNGSAEGTTDPDVELRIQITDGEVSPPPDQVRVNQGDRVRIEVASDQPDSVHVHGYDIEGEVSPSEPAVLEFEADQTGRFEVETHESGLQLAQLLVE